MATIKSYTDYLQSKVLSKILSDESADMWYQHTGISIKDGSEKPIYFPMVIRDCETDLDVPCWSLAALLSVLPKYIGSSVLRMNMSENDFNLWFEDLSGTVDEILPDITKYNPIDACYEMILKLNELKML